MLEDEIKRKQLLIANMERRIAVAPRKFLGKPYDQARKVSVPKARPKLGRRSKKTSRLQRRIEHLEKENRRLRTTKRAGRVPHDFYGSTEWRMLRYNVLKVHGRKCMLCGDNRSEMHVDHIKPRSKFPELALSFDNLQVLCKSCNLGKMDTDDTDFRP